MPSFMRNALKIDIVNAWYSGEKWLTVFRPLSILFGELAKQRKISLQRKQMAFPVPIVVVGNITVGGTGKTPVVLALAEQLKTQGYSPVIISRGFGGQLDPTLYPFEVPVRADAAVVGDEPAMMAARQVCPVVIDPNRPQAALYAIQNCDCDVIISDDGLQHYALPRDFEIVVIDGKRGFGNQRLLPEGPLREPLERLGSVDSVIVNGSSDEPQINQYEAFELEPVAFENVVTGEQIGLSQWVRQDADSAIAAIGNPQRFQSTLEQCGLNLSVKAFNDHYVFKAEDLPANGRVIMTEKDAVKCRSFGDERFWFLKVSASLPEQLFNKLTATLAATVTTK